MKQINMQLKQSDKDMLKELLYILKVRGNLDVMSESAIKEFGSLHGTLIQSSEDLKRIKVFTPNVIRKLKTIYAVFKEIIKPENYDPGTQTYEGLSYFIHTAPNYDGDCIRLLFLDENFQILRDYIYKKGSGNRVKFYFREIVQEVLRTGVSKLVIIHHKLEICCTPSSTDLNRFKAFLSGFKALDIQMVDFLIISKKALFSFMQNKLYTSPTQI